MKKKICVNCKYAEAQFKIRQLTHLHCGHNKYPKEDFESGKICAWDTLRVFSDTCEDFEYKEQ